MSAFNNGSTLEMSEDFPGTRVTSDRFFNVKCGKHSRASPADFLVDYPAIE